MSSLALRGRVVTQREVWEAGTVVMEDSTIRSVTREQVDADETLEMGGSFLVAGFVDLQINGAFGIDIATARTSPGALRKAAADRHHLLSADRSNAPLEPVSAAAIGALAG